MNDFSRRTQAALRGLDQPSIHYRDVRAERTHAHMLETVRKQMGLGQYQIKKHNPNHADQPRGANGCWINNNDPSDAFHTPGGETRFAPSRHDYSRDTQGAFPEMR